MIPDLIEIFILLFADDMILVPDTVCGLQNQLNVLFDTANRFIQIRCILKWRTYSPA